jgi:PEGA domain-containing protein
MSRHTRLAFVPFLLVAALALPATTGAQGRGEEHHAPPPQPRVEHHHLPTPPAPHWAVRGQVVFVGGYFYDPFYGPYPWWPRTAYPWYFPAFENRADVRIIATPKEAAVYVDGFYAGIVDDFDGFFQALPLLAGGHQIELFLEGYRTVHDNVYLRPGSTLKLTHTMERLPAGETSEPPPLATAVPPPPAGTYMPPRTARQTPPTPTPPPPVETPATAFGTLDLCVEPATADVEINGERWMSTEQGHYVIAIKPGQHRVEVFEDGHRRFSTEVRVREGETTPLDVNLR